jgi:hypothetical protein
MSGLLHYGCVENNYVYFLESRFISVLNSSNRLLNFKYLKLSKNRLYVCKTQEELCTVDCQSSPPPPPPKYLLTGTASESDLPIVPNSLPFYV